jgi:GrpB-like predicted nucleotidyltransferase (UPF0157 family)
VRLDPIIIRPYDASWPARFETQRQRISPVLRPWRTREVEHMGSTAVLGLSAKAIVDMLAVVSDTEATRDAIEPLARLGWHHAPEPEDDAERHLSFCFPSAPRRTHHLHVVETASPDWVGWLAFRDALRRDPVLAHEYADLKGRLAVEFGHDANDRAAYRLGKAEFITRVTRQALAERVPTTEAIDRRPR